MMSTKTLPPAQYQKWFTGKTVVLLIIAIIASVLLTRFFEKLHYDNLLQKSNVAQAHLSSTNHDEELDLKYIIQNDPAPINCYLVASSYAKQLCTQHNSTLNP